MKYLSESVGGQVGALLIFQMSASDLWPDLDPSPL